MRAKGYIVVLEETLNEYKSEMLRQAIGQLRGVVAVTPVPDNIDDAINRKRVRLELLMKIGTMLRDDDKEV